MIGLIVVSAIIGLLAGLALGATFGWIVFGVIFLFGLIPALIGDFITGQVEYTQDCAYDRQVMSDLSADRRAEEHEAAADRRAAKRKRNITQVYNDNRQVNISAGGRYDPNAVV